METIKRLVGNTVFPTAFVISGNLLNDWYDRSVTSLTDAQKSSTGVLVSNLAQKAYEGCSLANAKSLISSTGELCVAFGKSVYLLSPEPHVKSITDLLAAHSVEIGATAAIGATATVVDAVLKRIPYINRNGTLRVASSIGLATAAVYFGANELKYNLNPAMLIDIAIKVSFVGITWKAATLGAEYTFKGLGKASPIAERIFSGICYVGERIFHTLSYGELPAGVKVAAQKKKKDGGKSATSSTTGTPVKRNPAEGGGSSRTGTPVKTAASSSAGTPKGLPRPQLDQPHQENVVIEEKVESEEESDVGHPTTPKGQKIDVDSDRTASGRKILTTDVSGIVSDGEDEGESDSAE